jgi:hypothetical protein
MVSINGYGFPLKGYGFPLQGTEFPLHGNFRQNLKICFQPKKLKFLSFFLNYMVRDQL